ncbi:MAG: cryptochrome/photolyase family protein, partial [Anaerolineales bacterium]|nr:cryptochrome/photolyase family protein [Anaerolineales bacterium]
VAPDRLLTMAASSYEGRQWQQERLSTVIDRPVTILPNNQFLVGRYNPIPQPEPGKRYVMEHFYRAMRRHFAILLTPDGEPAGGQWNFDKENRQPLPADREPPADPSFPPDELTRQVMMEVAALPAGTGAVDQFAYAVTRADALAAFRQFRQQRLADFGPYEDAITERSHTLYHSVLSPYLNLGLLEPLELIEAVVADYEAGEAPLNSVEGFVRQILGWREFM